MKRRSLEALLLSVRVGEWIFLLVLALACIVTFCQLDTKPQLASSLTFHLGLFGGLAAVVALGVVYYRPFTSALPFLYIFVLTSVLYTSFGKLGFVLWDGGFDAQLSAIDVWLFGENPTFVMERLITPGRTEFLGFIYAMFLIYIYLSVLLGWAAFDRPEREEFMLGISLNWALAFCGYLLLPGKGPIGFHQEEFTVALEGGFFFDTVMKAFWDTGGEIGAFPSLHVGGSFFFCAFDWMRRPFRGMTYAPIVVLIAISTIYLRFHYVVDWFGGIAIALFSLWAAPRLLRAHRALALRAGAVDRCRS